MAQDYAKKRRASPPRKKTTASKKQPARAKATPKSRGNGWRMYGAGVLTGVFLSFLVYLGSLPPSGGTQQSEQLVSKPAEAPPKPRFDFYTMLPEHSVETESPATSAAQPKAATKASEYYLLQAGSFRQRNDADRRRAELLLLGLEPRIEESNSDNGRWFRVYVGPFDSRSKMSKARSLTAAQNIDTLLIKRDRS